MNTLISVIVPVFRVEKYINRCVDSLIRQTYTDIEIILVDDGSDDNCPIICDEYATKDSRIKVIHQKNGGLSAARNVGIKVAKGKYLAFVDSDDCVSKNYIEFLYRAVCETGSAIAQCNYADFENELPFDEAKYLTPSCCSGREMLKTLEMRDLNICSVVAWTKLYDAALFENIEYAEGKLHEDEFTTYQLFDIAEKVAFVDVPLYFYFQNSSSITGQKMSSRRLDALDALLQRYSYYSDRNYTELLPKTAAHIVEMFIIHSRKNEQDVKDFDDFSLRIREQYKHSKKLIIPSVLEFHDRVVFKSSSSFAAFGRNYRAYIKARGLSRRLNLSRLYDKLNSIKRQIRYNREARLLFRGYDPEKTIFIMGSIEYENLGDHAIISAQKKFLQTILPNFKVLEIRAELYENAKDIFVKKISPKSILTIPGGGNMGDVWFDDEKRRRSIIKSFPENKIVVFPQTVSYTDTAHGISELEASREIYNGHKNLCLCAREQASYIRMKELYSNCRVILVPDIVLSMDKRLTDGKRRCGVGICIRQDKERSVSLQTIDSLIDMLNSENIEFSEFSTMTDHLVPIGKRDQMLEALWENISDYKLAVTDRLHGMIFCYLTGTPCVVLDNINHKIESVYKLWLDGCGYIKFTDSEHLHDDVKKMYNSAFDDINCDMKFDFDELKRCFCNE